MKNNFVTKNVNETLALLNVDANKGLSTEEVNARHIKYGENRLIDKKKKSLWKIFFAQMKNPMIYILFAAILVTIGVSIYETLKAGYFDFLNIGDWADVVIILAVILLNAGIGTYQEKKAEASLEALKKLSSPLVNVIRNGENIKVKSNELTIGDIVILTEGDVISADMRLIESHNLKMNESSLTGESVPVEKNATLVFSDSLSIGDRLNMVYSSTVVSYGRAKAVVTNIGMETEIGKIAKSLTNEDSQLTPLQKVLDKLSKTLGIITMIIVALVFIADLVWIFVDGKAGHAPAWIEAILSSIALAVAAIPEGLVAVVTIVLALGVTRMVKANTIVRKLPSVETLGSVNVICSDKTGTLTQNKMSVVEAYADFTNVKEFKNNSSLDFLAKGLALCSDATLTFGDPTEIALINFAQVLGFNKTDLENEYPRTQELPFDSVRKMMSTKNKDYTFTKGALDSILLHTKQILVNNEVRDITSNDLDAIKKMNVEYSSRALRVLALAYTKNDNIVEEDLIFVGLVAMIDPPRLEVKDAVNKLTNAGIKTIMITGDHQDTAFAIAKELNIATNPNECMSGVELDKLSFDELKEKVKSLSVFARVSPQNKVDIVKALKANDQVVAMTGDGVNDAPSLKAADIGISMGITGTDVAKDASDMVLTDDNFASIEKAVEEGRSIFANIKKTVLFLLSSNMAEVFTMFILIVIGLPSPFIAIHLLWINLITDSTPAIALGVDPKEKDVMKDKPRNHNENFLSRGGLNLTLIYGGIITIAVVIAYFIPAWLNGIASFESIKLYYSNNPNVVKVAQTSAFITLAFSELFHMLGMSNPNESFINVFKKKNLTMLLAFILGIVLQIFVVLTPGVNQVFNTSSLNYKYWIICAALSLLPLIAHELYALFLWLKKSKK